MRTLYPDRQRGAVLIVALIMLLLISIIGTVAMRSATMEERMAGNQRERHLSFQAAEAALRVGEQTAVAEYPNITTNNGNLTVAVGTQNINATYQIEELATYEVYLEAGAPVDTSGMVVRVTASSTGRSGVADVRLESTYRIEN